jgi:hypothetical protein
MDSKDIDEKEFHAIPIPPVTGFWTTRGASSIWGDRSVHGGSVNSPSGPSRAGLWDPIPPQMAPTDTIAPCGGCGGGCGGGD